MDFPLINVDLIVVGQRDERVWTKRKVSGASMGPMKQNRTLEARNGHSRSRAAYEKKWKPLARSYGRQFVADLRTAIETGVSADTRRKYDRAARRIFSWFADGTDDAERRRLTEVYCSREPGRKAAVWSLAAAFARYADELTSYSGLRPNTAYAEAGHAAYVLEALGRLDGQPYPPFERQLHVGHYHPGVTPTLGSLPASSHLGSMPTMERERTALDLTFDAALTEFREHAALADWGTAVRKGLLFSGDRSAQSCIRAALEDAWRLLPLRPSKRRNYQDLIGDAPNEISSLATWEAAGLPTECARWFRGVAGSFDRNAAGRLALCCLGPSLRAVLSGAAVIACARGWNKSSILALPWDPFIFRSEGTLGIATGGFLAAVKRRAHHPVVMFLEGRLEPDDAVVTDLVVEWRRTAEDRGYVRHDDQALLDELAEDRGTAATLEVIRTLQRLGGPVRYHDSVFGACGRLFAFPPLNDLSTEDGLAPASKLVLSESTAPIFASGGVTFPSVRATYLLLYHHESQSITRTMAAGGQVTRAVTTRHYLNHAHVGEELKRALRFFQSVCQSLILDGQRSIVLGLQSAEISWFRRLADATVMAAAFGVGSQLSANAPELIFTPSEQNLRDLFLMLWSFRIARRKLPVATWQSRCLEPYAASRAIAAELRARGWGAAYAAAARRAYADCRARRVSLPLVEGS